MVTSEVVVLLQGAVGLYSGTSLFRTPMGHDQLMECIHLGVDLYYKTHIGTLLSVLNIGVSSFQGGGLEGLHCITFRGGYLVSYCTILTC